MIVRQSNKPLIQCPIANGSPLIISQIMFTTKDTPLSLYTTRFLNGQKLNPANLKHCKPIGIPIIVIHQITPANSQDKPPKKPPKINHKILPSVFILVPLLSSLKIMHVSKYIMKASFCFKQYCKVADSLKDEDTVS